MSVERVPVMARAGIAAALALALALAPADASAQAARAEPSAAVTSARDEEARSLFHAGRAAMSEGRYEDALGYFERAYELSPRAALLFNIGAVAERLRRDRDALEAYRAYLAAAPEAENRLEVERRIALLEEAIAASEQAPAERAGSDEAPAIASGATAAGAGQDGVDVPLIVGLSVGGAALVVGAIVLGVVLGGGSGVEAPIPSGTGVVVTTLVRF